MERANGSVVQQLLVSGGGAMVVGGEGSGDDDFGLLGAALKRWLVTGLALSVGALLVWSTSASGRLIEQMVGWVCFAAVVSFYHKTYVDWLTVSALCLQ